jgi:hypothetical protein
MSTLSISGNTFSLDALMRQSVARYRQDNPQIPDKISNASNISPPFLDTRDDV